MRPGGAHPLTRGVDVGGAGRQNAETGQHRPVRAVHHTMDTYDALPYESTPFTETHPGNLAVLGRLFGLPTAAPEGARVLELGCASGGNLIPMAWYLREGRFLGVELSESQARDGQALIQHLALRNAEIRQGDILDLGDELGEFDFIVAHGVYSWAPAAVQEEILALCARHLAPTGVAYVSYNTLPGWRMRGMLRDILLYHTRRLQEPGERLRAACELLANLEPALAGLDAYSARYLRYEAAHLLQAHPSYLFHEYLESVNEPVLFTEFMARAGRHDLQYLCEADLQSMFASTLGDAAVTLIERFDDVVEQEQYIDFLRNRNFRQTLLCLADQALVREITLDRLDGLALFSNLSPPKKVDLRRRKEAPFKAPDGTRYPASHPLTKAALTCLAEAYPDALAFDVVAAEAKRLVSAAGASPFLDQLDALRAELFSLYANQAIGLHTRPRRMFHAIPERPRATALARAQAEGGHLATAWHATLKIDNFAGRLVSYLDGTRTPDQLATQLGADVLSGALAVPGEPVPNRDKLTAQVAANDRRLLDVFARQGLLEHVQPE